MKQMEQNTDFKTEKCPNCSWVQEHAWVSPFLPFPSSFFCMTTDMADVLWEDPEAGVNWSAGTMVYSGNVSGAWIGVGA